MTEKTRRVIRMIAAENGVSPEYVEQEMRVAIRQAMATDDPQAQALWRQLSLEGKEPELEDFFEFVIKIAYLQ